MKNKLFLTVLFLSLSTVLFAQEVERVEVNGKIIAKNDVEGVTIYNASANKGTVADENGDFKLEVALNDVVEVSALQYVSVEVSVTQDVVDSRILRLFLVEELNRLSEVILLPSLLTGEIHVDIDNADSQRYIEMHFGDLSDMEFGEDQYSEVRNIITSEGKYYNGVDFARIFGLNKLFKRKDKTPTHKEMDSKYTDVLAAKYSQAFISGNFNIPNDRVTEFIAYVNSKDFDQNLLQDGNEMKLIEYLNTQSKQFLKSNNGKE
ncbi:carboxypeptidase-like regulatory domain-containing protein [Hanstruepera ponticola]|uniref:carboxypeptidase-like regulatory domain-containing protein n=1 Tax=Hanstruepera ponticola TaxID=2042995 RepID=UPI001780CF1B|nr:carboxypeptidase-like regulatory domain-containing protein [Hanstruepera ponticola]